MLGHPACLSASSPPDQDPKRPPAPTTTNQPHRTEGCPGRPLSNLRPPRGWHAMPTHHRAQSTPASPTSINPHHPLHHHPRQPRHHFPSLQPIAHYRAALLPPSCTCDLVAAAAPKACSNADRGAIDRPTGEPHASIRLPERRTAPREVNCKGHVSLKFFSADFAFVDTHSPLIDIPPTLPHDRGIISAS